MASDSFTIIGFDRLLTSWIAENKPSTIEVERIQAWIDALRQDPEPAGADQLGGHSGILEDAQEDWYHARIDGTSAVATWEVDRWGRRVVGRQLDALPDA